MREVELKFSCGPADLDRILAAAPPGEDETLHLVSTYYDTPDEALAAQLASLRVREENGRRVQTLKVGKGVSREEHEAQVEGLDPDVPALAALLDPAQRAALAAVSEVRITRRQRRVRFAGAEIEIAADLGEARAGGRSAPVSELELELKSGPEAALHALAVELAKAGRITPSSVSKADQARALRHGT